MASSQTIAEAVENSLNAFNIVSRKNLEAVSYDETIKCKIVDITNRDLGEYRVSDGVSTYTAYSEKTDYYNGCLVWVTIPQGNYSNQKLITGKYIESDNSEPYTYVSPLDSFIDLTSNLIEPGTIQETGLVANGVSIGKPKEIELWSIQGRQLVGYDRLAIQGSFKSYLKNLNVKSGTYGLRLDIFGREMGTSQTSNDRTVYSIELNTNDFFGDPYNFETFYPQVKVVDISMIGCIDSMVLTFYQGQNFYIGENKPLVYSTSQQENTDLSNIWVDSPYISLGYALDKFKTDTVLLYSLDSSTYASYLSEETKERLCSVLKREDFENDEQFEDAKIRLKTDDGVINETLQRLNRKVMHVRWIHFEDGKDKPKVIGPDLSLVNDNTNSVLPEGAVLHWYHYRLEEGVKDSLAGVYWEEISSDQTAEKPYDIFKRTFYPDKDLQSEKFKVIIEMPSQEMVAQSIFNSYGDHEIFWDNESNPPVNYYPEGMQLLENETFYEWVNRGLDTLEEKKKEIVTTLGNQNRLEGLEDEIYEEYLNALEEAGLTATQAEANSINEIYRKKMMNVKISLENERDIYVSLYNAVLKALSGVTYYYSDILEFTNEDQLPNQMTIQLLRGLQLEVDDDYHGNYRIYNEEGQILSKKESQKKRTITASWTSIVTGDRGLDGIERIEWYIPVKNTMIEYPQKDIEYSAYDEYPVDNAVHYDSIKNRPLYVYNKEEDKYKPVNNLAYERNTKYFIKNTTTFAEPSAERPDYFLITRAGKSFEDHEPGTEEASASGQVFRIKEFYNQTLVNNTIKCIVWKNNSPFEANLELHFGPVGTNGTDYTFELEIANKVQALTAGQTAPESSIMIIPHLYDYTGQDIIKQYKNRLKYSWWSPSNPVIEIKGNSTTTSEGQEYWTSGEADGSIILTLPAKDIQNHDITITKAQYHILYAELTNAVDIGYQNDDGGHQMITLTTFKPIPVRSDERYVSIDGADRVSYNSSGVNPSYYKDPYHIYVYNNKKTIPIEEDYDDNGQLASENPVSWEVSLGTDTVGAIAGSVARKFYPTLSAQNALIPPSFFLQDNGKQVAVNATTGQGADKQILWTQPLYIYQNSYTSALLNSWDGKLTVDEESGIILSTAVGAGAKDEKNRYNGVLMGDLRGVDSTPTFGLYGYNEGLQSFGFKIDGTAFIGKSGKGQINFDGNSGRISSLSYKLDPENPQGMLIDLDDGYIDMHGADLQNVQYTKNDGSKEYYTIDQVLQYQNTILTNEITELRNAISELNEWADKVDVQRKTNRIRRAEAKRIAAQNTLAAFQQFVNQDKPLNDFEKLKWLQDHNATYLINDDVFTPQYEISGSHVRISVTDPYFLITSENKKDLIHIGKDEYFLQTDDYISEEDAKVLDPNDGYGQGLKINLRGKRKDNNGNIIEDDPDGYIEGYNFKLKGVNNGQNESSASMKDSYFELNSSGTPFLTVHYKDTNEDKIKILNDKGLLPYTDYKLDNLGRIIKDENNNPIIRGINTEDYIEKDLIYISKDDFYLQSWNYIPAEFQTSTISGYQTHTVKRAGSGVLLDLTGGKLYGHDFEISTVDSGELDINENSNELKISKYKGSYVRLSSSGDPYFRIHYQHEGYEKYPTDDDEEQLIERNIDIINISKSAYVIASKDFQIPNKTNNIPGRGIRFDLEGDHQLSLSSSGKANRGSFIEAYSFGLDAYRPGLIQQDPTARIRINSAASGTLDKTVANVNNLGQIQVPTVNQNYLNSPKSKTYSESQIWKVIDERYKKPLASGSKYNQTYLNMLEVEENGYCPIELINIDYYDNPLMIGGLFSVSWDGKVTMGWLEAIQGGKIGPFYIREKALYSNNGILAYGRPFYAADGSVFGENAYGSASAIPTAQRGVYLGRDGLSVRDKFVVYKYPINKPGVKITDKDAPQTFIVPSGFDSSGVVTVATKITDFISSSSYTQFEEKQYFEDCDGSYDQVFKSASGNIYALENLSFYLNGNSVLNGKTAINGNTYIMGNFRVGEPEDFIGEAMDKSKNTAVMYANTTIYGVFRTTGKSYIGAADGKWYTDSDNLREEARTTRSAIESKNAELGFIVYRNSYISGLLKVAGSMVIGDSNASDLATAKKYDSVDLHGDFTAYVVNSKFYGDVEVAAAFVAGSLKTDEPASPSEYNFPTVPQADPSADDVAGSGIQAKYIFLGRNPKKITVNTNTQYYKNQSNLNIYANTEQWGDFIAGRQGKKIELYACSDYESTQYSYHSAYFKMNSSGIFMSTYANKPFELKTNGGKITISGMEGPDGEDKINGGTIELLAGTGQGRDLLLKSGDNDYIKFEGYNDATLGKRSKLIISATGSFKMTIAGASGDSIFQINQDGMKIELKNSLDFSITGTKDGVTNKFSFSQDEILLQRGTKDKLSMSANGTEFKTTSAIFSITAGTGSNINKFIMDENGIEITSFAASFSLTAGDNKFILNNTGITLYTTAANFTLTAGENQFTMSSTQIYIKSAAGPTATFDSSGISLISSSDGGFLKLSGSQAQFGVGGATITAATVNGTNTLLLNGQTTVNTGARMDVNGDLYVNGNLYANNLQIPGANGAGVSMGGVNYPNLTGFSGGFGGGIGGNSFGNWHVKGLNWETISGSFILDAEHDCIKWLTGDQIDASGGSAGAKGITITSSNAIKLTGPNGIWMYCDGSFGSAGMSVTKDYISLSENTVSHNTLYFGSAPAANSSGGSYYINNDGVAVLKGLTLPTSGNGLTVYELSAPSGKDYIKFNSNIYASSGIRFSANGNYHIDNSANAVLNDLEIGIGNNRVAEISNTGSIYGKNLYITSNGQSGGTNYFSVTSSSVTIPQDKLSYSFKDANGTVRQLSQLKKLAFADDVKKKIKLNFNYQTYSGSTNYITTLSSKTIYTLKDYSQQTTIYKMKSSPTTIYKMKSSPTTIYKMKTSPTTIYKEKSSWDRTSIYKNIQTTNLYQRKSATGYHYDYRGAGSMNYYYDDWGTKQWGTPWKYLDNGTTQSWTYYWSGSTSGYEYRQEYETYNYYSSVSISDIANTASISDIANTASISDIANTASISDIANTASISDIADTASISDIADKRKFTWNLDKTTNGKITFEANEGEVSDTIELDNGDFVNPISLTITSETYT